MPISASAIRHLLCPPPLHTSAHPISGLVLHQQHDFGAVQSAWRGCETGSNRRRRPFQSCLASELSGQESAQRIDAVDLMSSWIWDGLGQLGPFSPVPWSCIGRAIASPLSLAAEAFMPGAAEEYFLFVRAGINQGRCRSCWRAEQGEARDTVLEYQNRNRSARRPDRRAARELEESSREQSRSCLRNRDPSCPYAHCPPCNPA